MPEIQIRGATLSYRDHGEGRPVVFLHGVWMSGRFFERQIRTVGAEYRALALDFRGHGASEPTPDGHTVPEYAADLRQFLVTLGLEDVVLVGWSMGAFVIWDYVRQFGCDRLAGTVIVDESPSDFAWPGWDLGPITPDLLRELNEGVQTARQGLIAHFIPAMFAGEPSEADVAWIAEEMAKPPAGVASAILVDQSLRDYREHLAAVTVPTLVVHGADEKLITVAAGRYVAEHCPDARLVVFDESSHCPFLEEPERFDETLLAFLSTLASRSTDRPTKEERG